MDIRSKNKSEYKLIINTNLKNIKSLTNELINFVDCTKITLEFISYSKNKEGRIKPPSSKSYDLIMR